MYILTEDVFADAARDRTKSYSVVSISDIGILTEDVYADAARDRT
jgi:hypothetical protein